MFKLILRDIKGVELSEGDIVKIKGNYTLEFYCEVKYLEDEKTIVPFHTFSFASVEKVEKVPDNAIPGTEERYKIWSVNTDVKEDLKKFEDYHYSWKSCEKQLSKRQYCIERL